MMDTNIKMIPLDNMLTDKILRYLSIPNTRVVIQSECKKDIKRVISDIKFLLDNRKPGFIRSTGEILITTTNGCVIHSNSIDEKLLRGLTVNLLVINGKVGSKYIQSVTPTLCSTNGTLVFTKISYINGIRNR